MDQEALRRALGVVRERMAGAAERSGRRPEDITLMAVTKTLPYECAAAAMAEGITVFGENRVQEAAEKWVAVPEGAELHLIGHLQRNKARLAATTFSWVQSVDKIETARALSAACAASGKRCAILLEVNTSGEATKSGVGSREELAALLEGVVGLVGIEPRGLMTVGPLTDDAARVRLAFSELRSMLDDARRVSRSLHVLSMGMSSDYEIAVEEGSTLVRLGTALFGPRTA
jgi:PLP dependent protein